MALEVEARLLDVDAAALRVRLHELGAAQTESALFRESLFITPQGGEGSYLRVRDDGRRVTVTHKAPVDALSRVETEFGADDFEAAVALFHRAGLPLLMHREKHRTSYRMGDAVVSIDQYPGIPALAEVEAPDAVAVAAACQRLGLDAALHFAGGVLEVLAHYGLPQQTGCTLAFTPERRAKLHTAAQS